MTSSDFSLAFLSGLGHRFSDQDIEDIWHDRVFPLVCTDDFSRNWVAIPDPNGLLLASSGERCRVDAQPHHAKNCQKTIYHNGIAHQETISYESVVFAKVAYQLSVKKSRGQKPPTIIEYRHFVDNYANKMPSRWRNLIIQCGLHLYDENKAPMPQSIDMRVHAPLANSKNIRLLEILPSTDSYAPIQCTLREAGLPSASKYEALSYVWGQGGATRSILLNGKTFPVGENLEAALRQFRPRGNEPRAMWIDAVCIDQSNIQERTEQVAQMDIVYRNAVTVEVWLGRESDTSAALFNSMNQCRKDFEGLDEFLFSRVILNFPFQPEEYCAECENMPHDHGILPRTATGHVPEAMREIQERMRNPALTPDQWIEVRNSQIEHFIQLLRRPWWRRVWVLQEVILAKKVTLHCGSKSVDWTFFQGILYTLIRQGRRSMIHHIGGLSHKSRQAKAQAMLLTLANSTFPFFFLQAASLFTKEVQGVSMANLISLTWNFEATDPRDRIFALIGLLPEESRERLDFKPDYSVNEKRFFIRTAKHFLETTQTLEILTARPAMPDYYVRMFELARQDGRDVTPSWVPDWEQPHIWQYNSIWINGFSPLATLDLYMRASHAVQQQETKSCASSTEPKTEDKYERLQVFNASLHRKSPFAFEFSACDELLHSRGVTVDVVSEVGEPWDLGMAALSANRNSENGENSRQNSHNAQVAIIERWKSIAHLQDDGPYPFADQSRKEAFWRTLFLDRYRSSGERDAILSFSRLPNAQEEEKMAQVFKARGVECRFPPQDADDEVWLIYYLRHEVTELWSFASVNLHCANLSLFRTAKGYIGVSHPNVQPGDKVAVLFGSMVPLVLREYPEGHILIGESYVHGIMDGEIMRERMEHGMGAKEDFELFSII